RACVLRSAGPPEDLRRGRRRRSSGRRFELRAPPRPPGRPAGPADSGPGKRAGRSVPRPGPATGAPRPGVRYGDALRCCRCSSPRPRSRGGGRPAGRRTRGPGCPWPAAPPSRQTLPTRAIDGGGCGAAPRSLLPILPAPGVPAGGHAAVPAGEQVLPRRGLLEPPMHRLLDVLDVVTPERKAPRPLPGLDPHTRLVREHPAVAALENPPPRAR